MCNAPGPSPKPVAHVRLKLCALVWLCAQCAANENDGCNSWTPASTEAGQRGHHCRGAQLNFVPGSPLRDVMSLPQQPKLLEPRDYVATHALNTEVLCASLIKCVDVQDFEGVGGSMMSTGAQFRRGTQPFLTTVKER
jgi:hypothetical protein